MAGIFNNNRRIPSNGADFFGDKLVGNQFVDGTSQFTLGNFEIKSNVSQKDSRDFSLGNFSEPITLETLNIQSSEEARILSSNRLEVFINYDRSKISNFTLYGSLRERFKVSVQNVIKNFPAALVFKRVRDWSDYRSGNTATNISYNQNTDTTDLSLRLYNLYNPFSIEFTKSGKIYTDPTVSPLRNLTLEYLKYSLFCDDVEYPISFLKPTSGNTTDGILRIVVEGNPFSGVSETTKNFIVRPNTLTVEEVFDAMGDVESYLVERNTKPIYTAKFEQPRETSDGKIIKTNVSATWPSTDNWNLIIAGGLFDSYIAKLNEIGDTYDSYKTNLISRFLTTAALKEFDTFDEKVDKVLKIYGRSFDEVKKYIDGIAYMTNVTYDGLNNIPNELLKNFAQTLGWKTPSAIENEGFLSTLFDRNKTNEYSGLAQNPTPTELDHELYRRLLVNTAYLFKSKGTRRGIEFMLRFVGAPEALIEFNEHVYVAGQPLNMNDFRQYELKISGGTYTEEVPVAQTYFSALTESFPPIVVTGYTFGYETITRSTNIIPSVLPVDSEGYPTVPRYGPDSYFQSGAGWFEETTEHQGKKVVDVQNSVFTGNTPFIKTKLNQFSYGEPYLDLYRKFPDSKLGFPIVRTVDNKKSWVRKDGYQKRFFNLPDRGTHYQTDNDKLVINVKNVDIFLNIGQGLTWDVWNFSRKYSCPFGANALSYPYPSVGGPDWTQVVVNASKLSFFEFAQKFWTVLINVKNRQTIDDGHGGGYPTLLKVYLDYLESEQTCGIPSNSYTYEKMIKYVENMGNYWIRLLEQMVPSTTIWQGGIKYENSIFHRYKFAYKHQEICDDCAEPIPENPQGSGEVITTNPNIFKESIFNVSGQDCIVSVYRPCEELTDPCACNFTVTPGVVSPTQPIFLPGQVVCCSDDTGVFRKWVAVSSGICKGEVQFPNNLCDTTLPANPPKCWKECTGEVTTIGGVYSQEIVTTKAKAIAISTNAPLDPCDPNNQNPTDGCDCKGVGRRNLDLDFYSVKENSVPKKVIEFFMDEDQLDPNNWTNSIGRFQSNRIRYYKARVNICCLGDKFTHYFRVYNERGRVTSSSEITYGDIKIDFNVDQNCVVEFYYVTIPLETTSIGKMFMHIPNTTINNNSTITVVDNPNVGTLSNDSNVNAFTLKISSLTYQIGQINKKTWGFFKVDDSTYLTDNGTNTTITENGGLSDRYWFLKPRSEGGTDSFGAITKTELQRIIKSNTAIDSTSYNFNWEMELSCEGIQTIELNVTINSIQGTPINSDTSTGGGNTINVSDVIIKGKFGNQSSVLIPQNSIEVPFTEICGTNMSAAVVNQNESADNVVKSFSNIQTSGGLTEVLISKTLKDINENIDLNNYRVIDSQMYVVNNFNPLQSNRAINYNSPKLSVNLETGLTYETFDDNGRQRAKLGWLDDLTKDGNTKLLISFVSDENKRRFEQDLKFKNVGQGVEFLSGYDVNNTSPTSTNGKTKFIDLRDWASRSLGNVNDFSNSSIVYGTDGLVSGFEVGPTYTTEISNSQYKIGTVPIGDPHTEFLVSTMGSFEKYINYQTGTTSSAVTINLSASTVYYSGYTNLSGFTNNEGLNLSPDFVFDISLSESKISLNTGVALSDPTFSQNVEISNGNFLNGFKLIGDDRNLRPAISTKLLSSDNQLFFLPREDVSTSGDYFYYKVPKTQNYRIQYKSCIYFDYFDEGWCTYLDTYRQQSNNTFPVNDYDFKQLINSSIVYGGGAFSANYNYKEGNVVNEAYKRLGTSTRKLSPIFGYNANSGIRDFYFNVYVERRLSGTTATTIIGNYTIGSDPTKYPSADDYLLLPINDSDKFTNLYECTGLTETTKIFEKKFIPYIDTGCIELNKDDEIRLRVEINWENTTKNNSSGASSGLTASTISLTVGTDYSKQLPERPWFRIINKECNVRENPIYLYWQSNEVGPVSSTLYSRGQTVPRTQGSEIGKLILTENNENLDYVTPTIRINNLQKLTYLDIPEDKNYNGPLKFINTSKKTNRWVRALEENRITDFTINSSKILQLGNGLDVMWNMPIPTQDNVDSISLDDPKYTFMVESTIEVKGTEKTFKILNTYKPDFKSDTTKEIKVNSSSLLEPSKITYTSTRPLEERTIDFDYGRTIISERIVAVDSVLYDKNTPVPDKNRTEYCKCGDGSYIAVPTNSTVGCDRWCCVNSYRNSTYYPCREKTINEWADGLNLTRVILPNANNGIIRGL